MFLQSEYCFSEVITNCLELSFIDVMMKVYELILKYGLEVGTHNRGYNGMTLSFTVGEMLRTILGIKDLLSLWFYEITALVSFYGSFIVINMAWFLEGLWECQIVRIKLSWWNSKITNQRLKSDTRVVPAPDGTIYLVDINETHYWGSFYVTCIGVKNTLLNKLKHTNTCRIKWCMYWWIFFIFSV